MAAHTSLVRWTVLAASMLWLLQRLHAWSRAIALRHCRCRINGRFRPPSLLREIRPLRR